MKERTGIYCMFCHIELPLAEKQMFKIMKIHEDCYEKNAVRVRGISVATAPKPAA